MSLYMYIYTYIYIYIYILFRNNTILEYVCVYKNLLNIEKHIADTQQRPRLVAWTIQKGHKLTVFDLILFD